MLGMEEEQFLLLVCARVAIGKLCKAESDDGYAKAFKHEREQARCWHFLAQSLGMGLLSSSPATAPEILVGIS